MDTASEEQRARNRLQQAVRDRRSSLAALSKLIGRNAAYLQQYVTRGSPRHLDAADMQTIAEFLGVPVGAIDTHADRPPPVDAPGKADWIVVPRLALDVSAGPGSYSAEEISYDHVRFSRRFLREMGLDGGDLSALRVEGDSMEPLLRSGDEIFVDRAKRSGEGVFVVRVGDALHVKQLQLRGGQRIALISANAAYAPIELAADEVEIIGRVVWKAGRV